MVFICVDEVDVSVGVCIRFTNISSVVILCPQGKGWYYSYCSGGVFGCYYSYGRSNVSLSHSLSMGYFAVDDIIAAS